MARPAAAAVLAGLADLARLRRRASSCTWPTASPPGASDADRRPAHEVPGRRGLVAPLVLLAGCSHQQGRRRDRPGRSPSSPPAGRRRSPTTRRRARGTVGALSGDEPGSTPGTTWRSADYPGEVVVLNIWGSWCGPCRTEAPDLQFVASRRPRTGVRARHRRARRRAGRRATSSATAGITYDSISDHPGRSSRAWRGTRATPCRRRSCSTSSTGSRRVPDAGAGGQARARWCSAWRPSRAHAHRAGPTHIARNVRGPTRCA